MSYQGWTNYETWAVSLWLDNDEGLYYEVRELARRVRGKHKLYDLADALEQLVEDNAPDLGATLYGNLLTHAMAQANWREIAEHLLGDDGGETGDDDDDD